MQLLTQVNKHQIKNKQRMSLVKNYQELVSKLVNNYLKKFPVYKSDDFKQDVWLKVIEKENNILLNYQKNGEGIITFESYLGRVIINICKDLGTREYAKIYQTQQKQVDIQDSKNISAESNEDSREEYKKLLLIRINNALEHKSFEKSKAKIRLYMNLKQGIIDKNNIIMVFKVGDKLLNKAIRKLKKAKKANDTFEAIAILSGKTADTEQRWFNYQLAKLRELVNQG